MSTCRTALLLSAALATAGCDNTPPSQGEAALADTPGASAVTPSSNASSLAEQLAATRPQSDRDRDAARKPAEVLHAVGIQPGMRVLDVMAGGGWYTQVLAVAVGPDGQVTAQNSPGTLRRQSEMAAELSRRMADGRLQNVRRLDKAASELGAQDGPFDAALLALGLHHVFSSAGEDAAIAALQAIHTTLAPEGFLVIIDHEGVAANDNKALHRLPKADAVRLAEAAGFVLDEEFGLLRSAADDMSLNIRNDAVRGKTSRFVLKFRKTG